MALVLASTSPRRRDLLTRLGVEPDRIAAPDIDENPRAGELPVSERERGMALPGERMSWSVGFSVGLLVLVARWARRRGWAA